MAMARLMASWLIVSTAHIKCQSSVPRTHVSRLKITCKSSPRQNPTSSLGTCTSKSTHTHTHTNLKNDRNRFTENIKMSKSHSARQQLLRIKLAQAEKDEIKPHVRQTALVYVPTRNVLPAGSRGTGC